MNLIGAEHPFFRVKWRRQATVAAAILLAVMEVAAGSPFWAVLFGGLAGLAAWELLITYKPPKEQGDPDAKS